MPTVPRYDNFQTTPGTLPQPHMDAPQVPDVAGQQIGQIAQASNQASAAMYDIAQQAAQVRVNAALNQVRQSAQTLAYDPNQGYLNLKGDAALSRPDGQPLPQEYGSKLDDQVQQISQGLGDDYQRKLFMQQAAQVRTQFVGDVQRHMLGEYRNFAASTNAGTVGLAADDAEKNWSNPDRIRQGVAQARAAVFSQGQLDGKSAAQIQLEQEQTASRIHEVVVQSALKSGQLSYANAYLDANKDELTPEAGLQLLGMVTTARNSQMAQLATTSASQYFQGQTQPTDFDLLVSVVKGIESGGRGDANADGTPVTSPKGAKYAMQVMPATAKNPGFGIQPAQNDTPAEYNRVGTQLLAALVKKYSFNSAQVMAAYNAGTGAVDQAIAAAKKGGNPTAWLDNLPDETKAYVKNGVAKLSSGGNIQFPTESEFVQRATAALGSNPTPEQLTLTQTQAQRQYELLLKSRNEQGDNALRLVQQGLVANGGDFNALDPQLKADLARYNPAGYTQAKSFAGSISNPDKVETDWPTYLSLSNNPQSLAKLTDAQFMQLRTKLSDADFKHFANERAQQLNPTPNKSFASLDTNAVNTALNNRLLSIGINPSPSPGKSLKDAERVATIQKFVRDQLYTVQAQTGQKLTPEQVTQQIDGMFAKNVTFRSTFLGAPVGSPTQTPMLSLQAGDLPGSTVDALKAEWAQKKGITNPTNDQLMRLYWLKRSMGEKL
ncbi:transglycosylase SLT domain-containing protein [Niveibacterium terrae]|uniref:transglycosylase SLT domain-containing protein n=1 Tax=Niveibacterium terrae TaxID=3373598 RepID=UPI003A91714D